MHLSSSGSNVTARRYARLARRLCVASLVLLAGTPAARAEQPGTFSLNVVRAPGAETCISGHQLATRLERWIGPVFAAAGRGDHAIEALLHRTESGWRARVVVSDADGHTLGERELRAGNEGCRRLDPQLMLVVALAIDPEVALAGLPDELLNEFPGDDDPAAELLRELEVERASAVAAANRAAAVDPLAEAAETADDSGPEAGRDQARPPSPEPSRSAGAWSWQLEAHLLSSVGFMPALAMGPGLELRADPVVFWPLMVSAGFWLPNQAELVLPTSRGDSIGFTMLQFSLGVCPTLLQVGALQVGMSGGLLVANRRADSDALESSVDVSRWSWGPFLGPRAHYAMSGALSLVAGASIHVPFNRDTFAYDDQFGIRQELFRPAAVAAFAEIGIALRL
jgi:hypothetical protein